MDEPLPEEFDIIIIGTGLPESVLSGALSRIGKSVLHIDQNKFYGSNWASFSIKDFDDFIAKSGLSDVEKKDVDINSLHEDNEAFIEVSSQRQLITAGSSVCYLEKVEKVAQALEDKTMHIDDKQECNVGDQQPAVETNEASQSRVRDEQNDPVEENSNNAHDNVTEVAKVDKKVTEMTKGDNKLSEVTSEDDKVSETTSSDDKVNPVTKPVEKMSANASDEQHDVNDKAEIKKPKYPTHEDFYGQWRRFNIDMAPKLMFSRGKLVELLIQSNVARYLEFRNVSRTLTLLPGQQTLQPVPCSRADVFNSKFVTVIEKRILMRVLTLCANYEDHPEEYEEYKDRPFADFLQSKRLSQKAQHFVIHSIAMVSERSTTLEGLKATKKFLQSLGRYGNSAFLWPMYGVGEIPQAFSRLSAVFGGTYCLRRNAVGIVVNNESGECSAIIDTQGQKIRCKHLVVDESNVPDAYRCEFTGAVSRAVYVTDKSVLGADKEHVSLVTIPPEGGRDSVRVIEVGPQCCVCPSKYYLVHALIESSPANGETAPKSRFAALEKILFAGTATNDLPQDGDKESSEDEKPSVLWASYFNIMEGGVNHEALPGNVHVMRGPRNDLGFDATMEAARELFEKISPDDEFLPRAPDPEEIVFDDEGYNTESNGAGGARGENAEEAGGDYADDGEELKEGEVESEETPEADGEDPSQDAENPRAEVNEP